MQEKQKVGFWNRGIVGLLLVFTIPAALTVGAMFVVAALGRIPGGEDSHCERQLNDNVLVRFDIYAYQAGFAQFQTQKISVSHDNGASLEELANNTVQFPQGIDCENNIQQLGATTWLVHNEKTIALSDDSGETWQIFNVCDEPRPQSGRCDADPLGFATLEFDENATGRVYIRQSITDEYGLPLYENGEVRIADEWLVMTDNAGRSWQLESE